MNETELPTASQRRQWLEEASPHLKEAGRAYLEAGRLSEALECFAAVKDAEGLALMEGQALESGDFFAWQMSLNRQGRKPKAEELLRIKEAAQAAGKSAFAQTAQSLWEEIEEKP
jgi:hypothetical protein